MAPQQTKNHTPANQNRNDASSAASANEDRRVGIAREDDAKAENTNTAYHADWAHFSRWCRLRGADPLPPSPELIGIYITHCAAPGAGVSPLAVSTIDRRLSGLAWNYRQRGFELDRRNRNIATVLAGIRQKHARPPVQKEAVLAEDILAMIGTLSLDLRDMRDRAILLIGYAGGLRRSEIVSLDHSQGDTQDGRGWIEIEKEGAVLYIQVKSGWREVEISRGSSDLSCPVHALEQWLHFAKIDFGPLFQRVTRNNRKCTGHRLSDKHVARLIKKTVLAAGIRSELPEAERLSLFSGHSLRTGFASSTNIGERITPGQPGRTDTGIAQNRERRGDRFRVNLTKAAGL